MSRFILLLGSSQQNGRQYIKTAKTYIKNKNQVLLVGSSRLFKSEGKGTNYNSLFFNMAFAIQSPLNPSVLYGELMQIENYLGRIRTHKNARRTIDIDVLMSLDFTYNNRNFFLPHKAIADRNFFVLPAIEALRSAYWPIPIWLIKTSFTFGSKVLSPLAN